MFNSIEEYLDALQNELEGADPALIQDAQSDAREHLTMALAAACESNPSLNETESLQKLIEEYGTPEETASAYREVERRTSPVLKQAAKPRSFIIRFFNVYADPRTWGALLFMFIALVTGIVYFTWAVTGLSFSVSFSIFIFGLPFALLFLLSVRGLALLEGRLVEALLGVRMPRRPLFGAQGMKWFERLKLLVTDKSVWLAILYMLLQMPLGVLYFSLTTTLIVASLGFMVAPLAQVVWNIPVITTGYERIFLPYWELVAFSLGGFLLLTLTMHLARGIGWLHGRYAKALLVS